MTASREFGAEDALKASVKLLVRAVAAAGPAERSLLITCQRCTNVLLYLLPREDSGAYSRRLRALTEHHKGHAGRETLLHADDNDPDFGLADNR